MNSFQKQAKQIKRNEVAKVVITDVVLDSGKRYPYAKAAGTKGNPGNFAIDLNLGIAGHFYIPAIGEEWWIERRNGSRWALAYREEASVSEKEVGDLVEEVSGTHYISAEAVLITQDGQEGLTGEIALAKITGGGVDGSLTFLNGILVDKVDPT